MGWTEIRNALQAAVCAAAGFTTDAAKKKCIWKFQDASQPGMDYVCLHIPRIFPIGQDGIAESTDLGRPAGEEVKLEVVGDRELMLEVECFSASVADSNDALATADRIRSGLALPSVRALVNSVCLAVIEAGPAQYVPSVVSAGFRGRAVVEVRCHASASAAGAIAEYVGYIAVVKGTITTTGGALGPKVEAYEAP